MFTTRNRTATVLSALALACALSVPTTAPAQAVEVDLHARMLHTNTYPNARGAAEYEAENGRREFEIHISGVRSLHGRLLTVRVHGTFVGRMRVGTYGRAHLERHTGVPRVTAGDVVRVRTAAGRLVTYGRFHRDTDH